MGWTIGLAGIGVQGALGFAQINAQKKASEQALKSQAKIAATNAALMNKAIVVVGGVVALMVVVQLIKG